MRREGFLLVAAALSIATGKAAAQPCFEPPAVVSLGSGLGPGLNELVAADFNRDGLPDLAGTASDANSVVVLLGTGTGAFGSPTFFPVGIFPASLVAADFNGDMFVDLAVANNNSGDVSVLIGTGTGSFSAGPTVDVSSFPSAITAGDFNGDGRVDLAVPGITGVEILLADGSGGFGAPTVYPAGVSLFSDSLITDDFNGDGTLDLAVTGSTVNAVVVMIGDGSGGFGAPLVIPVGVSPFSVASADFNRDDRRDLAVANRGTTFPLGSSSITVLLGNGDGTFTGPTSFAAGAGARDLAVGDVNRDGNEDLAVANEFCCGTDVSGPALSILLGNGMGGFASPSNFAVGTPVFVPGPFAVVLADFNRDGQLDVALGDSGSRIWIYLACGAVRADIPTLGPLGLIAMGLLVALVALSRLNARG